MTLYIRTKHIERVVSQFRVLTTLRQTDGASLLYVNLTSFTNSHKLNLYRHHNSSYNSFLSHFQVVKFNIIM